MRHRPIRFLAAAAGLALSAGAAYAAGNVHSGSHAQPQPHVRRRRPALRLAGHVSGLYPGAPRRLRVTIANRSPQDLVVRSVRVRVAAAGPRCPAAAISARWLRRNVLVPAHSVRAARFRVELRLHAPNACQHARFPLRFHAKARRV